MLNMIGDMAQNIAIFLLLMAVWKQQKAINSQQEIIRLVCKWQLKENRP